MIIVNNPTAGIGKNYFKNPNFAVIQGTASGTLANSTALPTASLGYLGETEWCIAASGGTPAYAFSAANESVTFTGAASTTAIYLLQRLESRDTNRLKGKTVTFSCELSNSLLTSVIWEVLRPTTTDDVHGTIATPTQTLIASGTFTVSSTLTRYSATFALPDLASRGLEVRFRVEAQTSGTWVVARLQLEESSAATNFNCGDYSEELLKCKRYFLRFQAGIQSPSVGDAYYEQVFPVELFSNVPVRIVLDAGALLGATVKQEDANNSISFRFQIGVNIPNGFVVLRKYSFSAHIP